jgi:hypothetical protein
MFLAPAIRRGFATASAPRFLTDAVAKAAIAGNDTVAAAFVEAFAPIIHERKVSVKDVSRFPESSGVSFAKDLKHDVALRYALSDQPTAVIEIVPPSHSRALVEIQQQSERYLPGRALAHASAHYLAAVQSEAAKAAAEKSKPMQHKK